MIDVNGLDQDLLKQELQEWAAELDDVLRKAIGEKLERRTGVLLDSLRYEIKEGNIPSLNIIFADHGRLTDIRGYHVNRINGLREQDLSISAAERARRRTLSKEERKRAYANDRNEKRRLRAADELGLIQTDNKQYKFGGRYSKNKVYTRRIVHKDTRWWSREVYGMIPKLRERLSAVAQQSIAQQIIDSVKSDLGSYDGRSLK